MPKQVKARAAQDTQEERQVRRLAGSHHAPADWKVHAQMVLLSWAGKTPNETAAELRMRPGSGRKPRLTEQERSRVLALVKQAPPGHLETQADGTMVARDEEGAAQWTLAALAQAAKAAGIRVKRSQIRRIYLREGVRWRHTHSWGDSSDPEFVPKGQRSSATTRSRPRGRRPSAPTNSDQ